MNGLMVLLSLLGDSERLEANRRRRDEQLDDATAALIAADQRHEVVRRRRRREGGTRCPVCRKRASAESSYCQHCGHRPARGFQ